MKKDIQKKIAIVGAWIEANQLVFTVFFSLALIAEVLIFPKSSDVRLFVALMMYWFCSRIGKLPGMRVFQLCLVLLCVTAVGFLLYGATVATERYAVWYVLFMAFGVVTQWRETNS